MRGGHNIFLKVREDLKIEGVVCVEPFRNKGGSERILNGLMVDATEGRDKRLLKEVHFFPNGLGPTGRGLKKL